MIKQEVIVEGITYWVSAHTNKDIKKAIKALKAAVKTNKKTEDNDGI